MNEAYSNTVAPTIEIAKICGLKWRIAPDGSIEALREWNLFNIERDEVYEPFDPVIERDDVLYAIAILGRNVRGFSAYLTKQYKIEYADLHESIATVIAISPLELCKTILRFDATAWREDLWRMIQSGYSREEYAATQQRLETEEVARLKRIELLTT